MIRHAATFFAALFASAGLLMFFGVVEILIQG